MIITFAHYKGGTGKTTSCLNVAGWLVKKGKKVLVVDLDPQGNATSGLGIAKGTVFENMFDVMNKNCSIREVIIESSIDNLHIAPADFNLDKAKLSSYTDREDALILKRALEEVEDYYDFVLIDTPPVHGHFIINGMAAADKVMVVLDPGIFALESLTTLKDGFGEYLHNMGVDLDIDSAILTKCNISLWHWKNKNIDEMIKSIGEILGKKVFVVPYSNNVQNSQIAGKPISHYAPKSDVGKAYLSIANRILNMEEEQNKVNAFYG